MLFYKDNEKIKIYGPKVLKLFSKKQLRTLYKNLLELNENDILVYQIVNRFYLLNARLLKNDFEIYKCFEVKFFPYSNSTKLIDNSPCVFTINKKGKILSSFYS